MTRVLVLGGSGSGKSAYAESLLAAEPAVEYVATAVGRAGDAEWAARIDRHRARRPPSWRTTETAEVAAVLSRPGPPVLLDSVTTWLARAMDDVRAWTGGDFSPRVDEFCTAVADTGRELVVVSDEVGSGVVPGTASGRLFRDALGRLNQRLAAVADEVWLVVAGLPLRLK